MTDITEQDRRDAREWANWASTYADRSMAKAAARYILATVDAPEPTLAEEVKKGLLFRVNDTDAEGIKDALDLAARVEQIEQEHAEQALRIDELDQECDRQCLEIMDLTSERDTALAEAERLTAERDAASVAREENVAADQQANTQETLSGSLPDPADVPEGQAWAVSIDDMEETAGFKASGFGWICYRELGGTTKAIPSDRITLVSRLVPAPRQITTREILDEAPRRMVIRDKDGVVCERASLGDGWYSPESTTDQTDYIKYPATVLWTPEVTK